MRRARRQNERGFALLLVFAMAAAVGVMLYLEMPRVAFEHQRNKEGLLAERGEEYIRAIQLFYKKTNRYPQKIEDLESTNNIRFLRRRYKDPMTGDEEWRLIHVDSAGQFVDSLVHKREEKKESGPSVLSSNIVGIGASAEYVPQAGEKTGAAAIKRASDRIIPGMGGANAAPSGEQNAQEPGAEGQSRSEGAPAQPGTNPQQGQQGQGPATGQPGQIVGPGQQGQPGQVQQGATGQGQRQAGTGQQQQQQQQGGGFGFGGGFGNSGNANPPAAPGSSSSGQQPGSGLPGSNQSSGGFGQSGFGRGSQGGQAGSNQAVQAIQGMLTNPNQSRMGGMGGATAGGSASGGPVQGGIVGVASKKDMEGIRVYNERSNYKEWEFLFDRKKALEAAGLNANGQPGQQGQQGQQGTQGQGTGSGSNSTGSPFGSFGGSGSQQPKPAPGGFGSGGFGSGSSSSGSGSGSSFGRGN